MVKGMWGKETFDLSFFFSKKRSGQNLGPPKVMMANFQHKKSLKEINK